jgi:hypothetical protein
LIDRPELVFVERDPAALQSNPILACLINSFDPQKLTERVSISFVGSSSSSSHSRREANRGSP